MNDQLHAKILNRCREAVAKERGFSIVDFELSCSLLGTTETRAEFENEATTLAMQEQAEFFEDIIHRVNEGLLYYSPWIGNEKDYRKDYLTLVDEKEIRFTIMELFEQWEREKTTTN